MDLRYVHVQGDLAMAAGQFVFADPGSLEDRVQKIEQRLRFFQGEWFLDTRLGVPFYRDIFVKNPSISVVRSVFRRVLLSVPGVVDVPTLEVEFDPGARHCTVNWVVQWQDGATSGSELVL